MAAMATGGDVILTLLQEVTDLREEMRENDEAIAASMEALAGQVRSGAKRTDERLGRVVKLIAGLSERLEDHERRLQALEARPGPQQ